MTDQERFRHLRIDQFAESNFYTAHSAGGGGSKIRNVHKEIHANTLNEAAKGIFERYYALQETAGDRPTRTDDVVYMDVLTAPGYKLKYESFEDGRNEDYRLLITSGLELEGGKVQKATVMLSKTGIEHFLKKINEFQTKITPKKGNPKHQSLFANIDQLLVSELSSFWNEPPGIPFPNDQNDHWWEVWIRKKTIEPDQSQDLGKVYQQLKTVGATISSATLEFPEHYVLMVKGSTTQLSHLLFLDNLAELRKLRETAEFFTSLTGTEQEEWSANFKSRIENGTNEDSVAVCLLDTGVNNKHPLLEDFLPDANLQSIDPNWGTFDGWQGGHGTQMAGLALYGDLSEELEKSSAISIFHQLESVKLINRYAPAEPENYGFNTSEAVNRIIIDFPNRPRVFCMAVTAKEPGGSAMIGRPSAWSSMMDQLSFGDGSNTALFLISAGNVDPVHPQEYPTINRANTCEDPSQAFNPIVVGAFTAKESITEPDTQAEILAPRLGLSPYSRTSCNWDRQWPIRPDIVMEGGNKGFQNEDVIRFDSLQLLSTNKQYQTYQFSTFWATSAATALASRMAANIMHEYPELRPETIRGLMVHSAEWTTEMVPNKPPLHWSEAERLTLLKSYGYGIPNYDKAIYTLKNNLCLIAEKEIQPFTLEGSQDRTHEMHLYQLPWPQESLLEMGELDVKLNVTLSYFIEPNPGGREYANNFSYQSHGLKFSLNKPDEPKEEFEKRINRQRLANDEARPTGSEKWILNGRLRNKGSIHRDIWQGTAADLATKNILAIYPNSRGWFRDRKKLDKANTVVRYSLIVSIETDSVDIDLYTPVFNLIDIPITL